MLLVLLHHRGLIESQASNGNDIITVMAAKAQAY